MSMDRTKCTALVTKVISQCETEETANFLKTSLFSVLVDESTDVSLKKNLCVLVKYLPPNATRIRTDLLQLVEVDAKDCSAEKLYVAFKQCFIEKDIPVENIVGLACDNCSVMTGRHNSFWTRLKTDASSAVLINCICHSSAIIASTACSRLPSNVKKLLRETSSYLTGSPKRSAQLEEFQEFYNTEYGRLKKLSFTRWLVLHSCVVRYLKLHPILLEFFRAAVFENSKDRDASWIFLEMQNPFTKAYLEFLEYALDYFNKFNALFQSKQTLIHKLAIASENILQQVCQNFVKPEYLNKLANIEPTHPHHLVALEDVFIGPKCEESLRRIPLPDDPERKQTEDQREAQRAQDIKTFRLKCLDFYSTAAKEMRERLPVGRALFKEMEFLDPRNAISFEFRSKLKELSHLCEQFKEKLDLEPSVLAMEWRVMPGLIGASLKESAASLSPEEFWTEVGTLRNFEDTLQFPQLTKLAKTVLILPHSNADAEGIFAMVTDVKTKKRNRMGNKFLNAICVSRAAFRTKNVECRNFDVKKEHLTKHNATMYVGLEDD